MTTIRYDLPVADFIDELNATGHVTHTAYRKTSVTIHHNAGRLSHEALLNVWKVRPASTHFDVDRQGAVAQFVKVNEYAWAVGNTEGNMRSISIEMSNSTLGPDWEVAEITWKRAARLTGWLFARVIGTRPSSNNVFQHKHWRATVCAGPHMDKVWSQFISEAQRCYDVFTRPATDPTPDPDPDTPQRKTNAQIAAEVWQGKWGNGQERIDRLTKAGYDAKAIQDLVDKGVGKPGGTPVPTPPPRKTNRQIAAEVWQGKWGNGEERIRRLRAAGYNPTVIQQLVNQGVGKPGATVSSTPRKSVSQLATEVLQGKWGNGDERKRRLTAAGYDYNDVQREVNRRLG